MYIVGFSVKRSFVYYWTSMLGGGRIVRRLQEGSVLPFTKDSGSLHPLVEGRLEVSPISGFDPKEYMDLEFSDKPYSRKSLPIKGVVTLPKSIGAYYKLSDRYEPLVAGDIVIAVGRKGFITTFGLKVFFLTKESEKRLRNTPLQALV